MINVIIIVMIIGAVVIGSASIVGYFNSGVRNVKRDLTSERNRTNIATAALAEIASGVEMPILVASDALQEMNRSYVKEINR